MLSKDVVVWSAIFGVALINMLLRHASFMLPSKILEYPYVRFLGKYLPASIMTILVLFCIKEEMDKADPQALAFLVSLGVVTVIHLLRRNTLLSIGIGTACFIFMRA